MPRHVNVSRAMRPATVATVTVGTQTSRSPPADDGRPWPPPAGGSPRPDAGAGATSGSEGDDEGPEAPARAESSRAAGAIGPDGAARAASTRRLKPAALRFQAPREGTQRIRYRFPSQLPEGVANSFMLTGTLTDGTRVAFTVTEDFPTGRKPWCQLKPAEYRTLADQAALAVERALQLRFDKGRDPHRVRTIHCIDGGFTLVRTDDACKARSRVDVDLAPLRTPLSRDKFAADGYHVADGRRLLGELKQCRQNCDASIAAAAATEAARVRASDAIAKASAAAKVGIKKARVQKLLLGLAGIGGGGLLLFFAVFAKTGLILGLVVPPLGAGLLVVAAIVLVIGATIVVGRRGAVTKELQKQVAEIDAKCQPHAATMSGRGARRASVAAVVAAGGAMPITPPASSLSSFAPSMRGAASVRLANAADIGSGVGDGAPPPARGALGEGGDPV